MFFTSNYRLIAIILLCCNIYKLIIIAKATYQIIHSFSIMAHPALKVAVVLEPITTKERLTTIYHIVFTPMDKVVRYDPVLRTTKTSNGSKERKGTCLSKCTLKPVLVAQ